MRDEQAPEPKETPRYARFLGATGCWPADDLGLIEAIDCLGERVVVRVADTAAFLTHLPSVCAVQPILAAIEETAAHRDGWSPA